MLRSMPAPTRADLEAAARRYFAEEREVLDRPREFHPMAGDQELAMNVEATRDRLEQLEFQLQANEFDGEVLNVAHLLARRAGMTDEEVTPFVAQQIAARVQRQVMRALLHELQTPWQRFTSDDEVFAAEAEVGGREGVARREATVPELTLSEAVERYLAMKTRAGAGSSHLDELARACSWLQEALGRTVLAADVTKAQARAFRDGIERLDGSLRGRAGIPFLQRQTEDRSRWITSVTANRYWRSIQGLFGWLTAEGFLTENVSSGLVIARRRDDLSRRPVSFTVAELEKLFSSPLYAGHRSSKQLLVPGKACERGSQWWVGILGLYTGLRAGEIAQLHVNDFDFDAPIPVLRVRREGPAGEPDKRVKTPSSQRDVPLADDLIVLGLPRFVQLRAKVVGQGRVLRDVNLGQKDRKSDGISKFWGRALLKAGVHQPGRSFHVFRHTFADNLRRHGVAENIIGGILGHEPATVTASYGGRLPMESLRDGVRALDFGMDVVKALGGAWNDAAHR